MRTHVTLDSMGALVEGVHDNPFELLGPHPVQQDGRSALAVRAFLPNVQQAWVLDPSHQVSRPMRRVVRAAGGTETTARGSGPAGKLSHPHFATNLTNKS